MGVTLGTAVPLQARAMPSL